MKMTLSCADVMPKEQIDREFRNWALWQPQARPEPYILFDEIVGRIKCVAFIIDDSPKFQVDLFGSNLVFNAEIEPVLAGMIEHMKGWDEGLNSTIDMLERLTVLAKASLGK
jgi:hypothetical protein